MRYLKTYNENLNEYNIKDMLKTIDDYVYIYTPGRFRGYDKNDDNLTNLLTDINIKTDNEETIRNLIYAELKSIDLSTGSELCKLYINFDIFNIDLNKTYNEFMLAFNKLNKSAKNIALNNLNKISNLIKETANIDNVIDINWVKEETFVLNDYDENINYSRMLFDKSTKITSTRNSNRDNAIPCISISLKYGDSSDYSSMFNLFEDIEHLNKKFKYDNYNFRVIISNTDREKHLIRIIIYK